MPKHLIVEVPNDPVQAARVLGMIGRTGHVTLAWREGKEERIVRVPARPVYPQ